MTPDENLLPKYQRSRILEAYGDVFKFDKSLVVHNGIQYLAVILWLLDVWTRRFDPWFFLFAIFQRTYIHIRRLQII